MQKTLMENEDFWTRVLLDSTSKTNISGFAKNLLETNEKLSQLEQFTEAEQKQAIVEMNEMIDGMDYYEYRCVFTQELFDEIDKMIEDKKLSIENAILLLKHIGYSNVLKNIFISGLRNSSLNKIFERMIIEEDEKKELLNEKLLVNLCECYFLLNRWASSNLFPVCVPCLLKVSLNKEKKEEAQKKVEMALLALSNIGQFKEVRNELFLIEIKEIIKHQQKHRNLTKLAYQSVWSFLIYRFWEDSSLKGEIVNEMHFGREAARELEELTRNVNWKKKKEEMNKEEAKEEFALARWLQTFSIYFYCCRLKNEEFIGLINSIVQIYRAAKDNQREICDWCVYSLRNAAERRIVKDEDLLKGGAIDAVLEGIRRPTLDDYFLESFMKCFLDMSRRLKSMDDENEEAKRKTTKIVIHEKMEEEGFEDTFTSFHAIIDFLNDKFYEDLSLDVSDYFANV